jgi:hypothetical protein
MRFARVCIAGLIAAPLVIAACDRSSTRVRVNSGRDHSDATIAARDENRKLGPGDVRVMNTDSSVEIAVIGDSIITGFGPRVIAEIQKSTDTSTAGNGFGAGIEKIVKGAVASALNKEIKYAIADVQDVRFEDGKLQFFWKDGSRMKILESGHSNDKPISETFRVADAQRFIAAFHARKSKGA